MESLGALYHWSLTRNREAIQQQGLAIAMPCVVSVGGPFPCICLSPTPALAWELSGGSTERFRDEAWDLWQVQLAETDDVLILPNWGPSLQEIRVRNPIPSDRVWWVAERQGSHA